MTGNNVLIFNQATLRKAVQHYFDTVLFAKDQAPTVAVISYRSSEYDFAITTTDNKTKTGESK